MHYIDYFPNSIDFHTKLMKFNLILRQHGYQIRCNNMNSPKIYIHNSCDVSCTWALSKYRFIGFHLIVICKVQRRNLEQMYLFLLRRVYIVCLDATHLKGCTLIDYVLQKKLTVNFLGWILWGCKINISTLFNFDRFN